MDNNQFGTNMSGDSRPPSPQPPQPQYRQSGNDPNLEVPMTVGDWVLSMLILWVPVVNLIFLFLWALSDEKNPESLVTGANTTKRNFARVSLIFMGISIILAIGLSCAIIAAVASGTMNSSIY